MAPRTHVLKDSFKKVLLYVHLLPHPVKSRNPGSSKINYKDTVNFSAIKIWLRIFHSRTHCSPPQSSLKRAIFFL